MKFSEGMGGKKVEGQLFYNGKPFGYTQNAEIKYEKKKVENMKPDNSKPQFGKSKWFENEMTKSERAEIEWRLQQEPKTFTDEEVRGNRALGQSHDEIFIDEPEGDE